MDLGLLYGNFVMDDQELTSPTTWIFMQHTLQPVRVPSTTLAVPLMSAETFPRLPGGIRSALRDMQRD